MKPKLSSDTDPQLDIIIVSYNTAALTLRAIRSVYEQTRDTRFKLIVVDNDSHDQSADKIAEAFPDLTLIRSPNNTGFSGGNNLGARYSCADHILLLNPDTVVLEGAIDRLYQFACTHPDNGIWGGITLNNDLGLNTHNAWARLSTLTLFFSAFGLSKLRPHSCLFNRHNYGCWKRDSVREVDIVQGCFFMTRRDLWEQQGGLDESFFMYGEEADYCLKAIEKGYQPVITPDARIIHHGSASEASFSGKMIKLLKGKVELVQRHSRWWEKPLHKGLLALYVLNKTLGASLQAIVRPANKATAAEWKKVWKARKAWLRGWSDGWPV